MPERAGPQKHELKYVHKRTLSTSYKARWLTALVSHTKQEKNEFVCKYSYRTGPWVTKKTFFSPSQFLYTAICAAD